MRPNEPAEGHEGEPATTPTSIGALPLRRHDRIQNRRVRLLLALVAGILALLCLGGIGLFVSLYDQATEIERTEPDVVVDNFLAAYLVDRDESRVALYACESGADLEEIAAYRADIVERESRYSVTIRVSWEGLTVSTADGQGSVKVDLTRAITGSEQLTDSWTIRVVDQDGWRVCGATKG